MLRFTVASAFQKPQIGFQNHGAFGLSSNVHSSHRVVPQRLQWLSRYPSAVARSLEVEESKAN